VNDEGMPSDQAALSTKASVSIKEAAILLGKSDRTVRDLIAKGRLAAFQVPGQTRTGRTFRIPIPLTLTDALGDLPPAEVQPTSATPPPATTPPVTQDNLTSLVALGSQILETVDQLKAEHHAHGQALEQLEANTRQLLERVTQFNARVEQAQALATTVLQLQ
jgi:excisionase family DNA binding protein